jgi:NAD(P)-dependent dehydrogenase (short-subunit alcohol dehydrogenase family)
VRVNAIAPGLVQTVLSEYFWKGEEKMQRLIEDQAIKHLGQPGEIAEVALLLAGDRGSYLTGQILVVDGGRLLG